MPILRHKMVALMGALALFSTVFLMGGVAQAQTGTGYPPGTTVTQCVPANTNAGTVAVGQTITFTLCGDFTAGVTVTVTVNGATVLTKTAPANGAVIVTVTVISKTVVQVGDPVNAAAVCGNNVVAATGAGKPGVSTGTFNLVCTTATTTTSGLAFTGANILRGVLIALVLIVIGALLVVFQRRRRQTT